MLDIGAPYREHARGSSTDLEHARYFSSSARYFSSMVDISVTARYFLRMVLENGPAFQNPTKSTPDFLCAASAARAVWAIKKSGVDLVGFWNARHNIEHGREHGARCSMILDGARGRCSRKRAHARGRCSMILDGARGRCSMILDGARGGAPTLEHAPCPCSKIPFSSDSPRFELARLVSRSSRPNHASSMAPARRRRRCGCGREARGDWDSLS